MTERKSNVFIRIASILSLITGLSSVIFNVIMICVDVMQYVEFKAHEITHYKSIAASIWQTSVALIFSVILFVFLIILFVSTFSNGIDTLKSIIRWRIVGIASICSSLVLSTCSEIVLTMTISYSFNVANTIVNLINGIINIGIGIFIILLCVNKKKNCESSFLKLWFVPIIASGVLNLVSIIRHAVTMVGTIGFLIEYEIYEQIAISVLSFLFSSMMMVLGMAAMVLLCMAFKPSRTKNAQLSDENQ